MWMQALKRTLVGSPMIANLREVRESGRLFAVPTYLFIGMYITLVGWGGLQWLSGSLTVGPSTDASIGPVESLTLFLILRAFASGCTALTGIEAVSNGVPAFRRPEWRNAQAVMTVLGVTLITLFLGITFLAHAVGVVPLAGETVNSQLARRVFGTTFLYYMVQVVTTLILLLAANTSFMARDRFMPRQFANRGDRLAFSNGIIILALLSALLLVGFQGDTHALIPLYAVGVFISFTLSQAGMVRHWFHQAGNEQDHHPGAVGELGGGTATTRR